MKLKVTSDGALRTSVFLNDEEVHPTSVDVHFDADSVASCVLGLDLLLPWRDGEGNLIETYDANVMVPEHTKNILIKLGWTPPKDTA